MINLPIACDTPTYMESLPRRSQNFIEEDVKICCLFPLLLSEYRSVIFFGRYFFTVLIRVRCFTGCVFTVSIFLPHKVRIQILYIFYPVPDRGPSYLLLMLIAWYICFVWVWFLVETNEKEFLSFNFAKFCKVQNL